MGDMKLAMVDDEDDQVAAATGPEDDTIVGVGVGVCIIVVGI